MLIERVVHALRERFGGSAAAGVGGDGENAAANHLRAAGLRILGRNFRTSAGEIDLVCKDGDVVVFVEVKTRADTNSLPESAVTPRKQRQISRVAEGYLARFGTERPAFRHDVVAVHWSGQGESVVHHYPSFFEHRP
ncbi:MAG: YraN family protein [Planctomycetota bacterium]